jgi:hypothetical protein
MSGLTARSTRLGKDRTIIYPSNVTSSTTSHDKNGVLTCNKYYRSPSLLLRLSTRTPLSIMPVEFRSATERFKIPEADGNHVFFRELETSQTARTFRMSLILDTTGDIFGTKSGSSSDRLVGIWFRIEKGPEAGPGVHDYDESGVVFEGMCCRIRGAFARTELTSTQAR